MPQSTERENAAGVGEPMWPHPFRIVGRRMETVDTWSLELEPENPAHVLRSMAGQFNMLYEFGVGEVPISIASVAGKRLLHTVRSVGLVTRHMSKLRRGDVIGVRGPYGSHWPLAEAVGKDVVVVGGGLGIAPLRGALHELLALKRNRVFLLYGARSASDIVYRKELEGLRGRAMLDVAITVDRSTADWRGRVGVVTSLIHLAAFNPENSVAFVCGPEIMMRFVVLELKKRGVAESNIFLSMERNMKCAIGCCGHCQFGPNLICRDGPIYRYDRIRHWLGIPEL